jgi:hypothetical protein
MTVLELESKKKKLIEDIDSEELLDKVQKFIKRLKKNTSPCRFSIDELREEVKQGEIDAETGLGISQEDMRKRYLLV